MPSALALIQTPAGTYTVSAGTTTLGADTTPAATDGFRIGSVTKTITAAAVLALVQEEKIYVDDPTEVWAPSELIALAFAEPPGFAPGTEFEYPNTNTILLGMLLEKVEGKTLDRMLKWIRAFVGGELLDDANQQLWWDSIVVQHEEDPRAFYGYGISEIRFGTNRLTYHEGQLLQVAPKVIL